MMTLLSIFAAALLFGYLGTMAVRHGIPDMVSDTYYQLQVDGAGWLFSTTLSTAAVLMMVCILDSGLGLQAAAFIGCTSIVFVALSPNYLSQTDYPIHKSAAILAATGCTAWCLSVNALPTLVIALAYTLYLIALDIARRTGKDTTGHPWYWAEVGCFADVWGTWWSV